MLELKLNEKVANRYYQHIKELVNSDDYATMMYNNGVCTGYVSALFIAGIIDFDCYDAMNEYQIKLIANHKIFR